MSGFFWGSLAVKINATLAFCDDFSLNKLDENSWNYRTGKVGYGNTEKSAVSVNDGNCIIDCTADGSAAVSGGIISKHSFYYGYYEACIKYDLAEGWHSRFWTYVLESADIAPEGTQYTEISIGEYDLGKNNYCSFNIYGFSEETKHLIQNVAIPENLRSEYHTYGCEYTAESITFYFDGVKVGETQDVTDFPKNINYVFLGCTSDSCIPKESGKMYIDYFKYYKINDADKRFETDRGNFYGVCYNPYYFYEIIDKNHNYSKALDGVSALGANIIRNFMHTNDLLFDPYTLREDNVAFHKAVIKKANAEGIEVIGQNHKWFGCRTGDFLSVPDRDTAPDSAYMQFLSDYEQCWYKIVNAFPEITYWEIGNEWNNDVFLHPYNYTDQGERFTFEEKADIATDMYFYASRGIHRANQNAVTIMGGLTDIESTGWGNAKGFLKLVYENIRSGKYPSVYTNEYFQVVCWHPYNYDGVWSEKWVQHNIDIYSLVKEYEGYEKPVFFTEVGFSDYGDSEKETVMANLLTKTLTAIRDEMPFVKSVCWFRLFNDSAAGSWAVGDSGQMEANFGLFTEPDANGCFSPKKTAEAYQKFTDSTADLDVFSSK